MRRLLTGLAFLAFAAPAAGALVPAISTSSSSGRAPLTVRFDASATAASAYAWSFGDGTQASGPVVSHRFSRAGRYVVHLTVTDDAGGTAQATTTIDARAITVRLGPSRLVYGARTHAAGTLVPGAGRVAVVVERKVLGGWRPVAHASTDSAGRFRTAILPARGGLLRARLADGTKSAAVRLEVAPRVVVTAAPATAFVGAALQVVVSPASYAARARVAVGSVESRVLVHGRARLTVPAPGIGRLQGRLSLPAAAGLTARTVLFSVVASARTLSQGASGPDVVALRARLAELGFHVPAPSLSFGPELYDSVIAFQKAARLDRTGVVTAGVWRTLATAAPIRPRYRSPAVHIEIDKTRQILLKVIDGQVAGVLPVSSGATGNTPVGTFHILWKAPSTGTWLGSATLYRTMDFHGNFAIHGFYSVPAYPASHGCVRIPVWAADWLYERSSVGEQVSIYY